MTGGTAQQALFCVAGLPESRRLHEGAVQSSALPSGQPGFLAAAVSGCSGLVSEPIRSASLGLDGHALDSARSSCKWQSSLWQRLLCYYSSTAASCMVSFSQIGLMELANLVPFSALLCPALPCSACPALPCLLLVCPALPCHPLPCTATSCSVLHCSALPWF